MASTARKHISRRPGRPGRPGRDVRPSQPGRLGRDVRPSHGKDAAGPVELLPAPDRCRRRWLLAAGMLLVIVCVTTVHWPALSAKALCSDDLEYLVYNPLVKRPSWRSAERFLTEVLHPSTVGGYYQPLSMISLMLDYSAGGRERTPRAFHRTSLALHAANSALVVWLIYALFGNPIIATMAGLLFGLHPMTVEPIAWISERKTLLASFFALAALVLYVYYARTGRWRYYVPVLVAFVLAVMSKPTSMPLPVGMLLMDYWPLRRLNWRAVREKIPLFAVAAGSAYITFVSQRTTFGVDTGHGPVWVALILCHNIVFYLYKIILPINLSPHYPFPKPVGLADPMVAAGLIGTFVLLLVLILLFRKTPAPLVGWLIFFVTILPTMGVVGFTVVVASDKFAYLPSVGLLMALSALLGWLWTRPRPRVRAIVRTGLVAAVIAVASLEAVGVRKTLAHWRDTDTLNRHMLSLSPDAAWVHNCTAVNLIRHGRFDEAIKHLRTAMRLDPSYAEPYNSMGYIYSVRGRYDKAVSQYRHALRLRPGYTDARRNLNRDLAALKRLGARRTSQNSSQNSGQGTSQNSGQSPARNGRGN